MRRPTVGPLVSSSLRTRASTSIGESAVSFKRLRLSRHEFVNVHHFGDDRSGQAGRQQDCVRVSNEVGTSNWFMA